ncbi:MAG: MATE family efflux transporter [Sphaerochaetaceae bacterium]|nr:MATE family efflux transporter [Sphaerochaetaceae bacterium]
MIKDRKKLMTDGSISKNIITFAIPIFLGTIFQELYNVVDSVVVGKFVNKEALAAVTSSGSLCNMLVGLFMGTFVGAGVVISKYYGADDIKSVRKAIHTSIAFALLSSILLTGLGYYLTPQILLLMNTPETVYEGAKAYVQIYFLGIGSLVMYNCSAGILRALGDSRHPLYFLIISSILNIIVDLILVIVFHFGVKGVAYATIFGQTVSAILAYRILLTTDDIYKVNIKEISFDKKIFKEILRIGIPSGIQSSVTSISNVFIQSSVNSFGAAAMAGNGAFVKIQSFMFKPITSLALSLTTYTSQNLGAGEFDRVKKGTRFGISTMVILATLIGVFLYVFSPSILMMFSDDPEVIKVGVMRAHLIAPALGILAITHCMSSIFRGAGRAILPMIVMLTCFCFFRVTFITIALKFNHDIRLVFAAYPISWTMSTLIFVIYYFKVNWMNEK